MSEDNQQIGNNPQLSDDFRALGFDPDSGEWEMLVENNPNITIGELVQSYLAIARSNYNATWNTIDDAVTDNTGINKRNIIRDVLESYSRSPPSADSPSADSPSTDAMDIDTIPIDTGTNPIDTDEMDIGGGKRRRKSKRRKSKRRTRKSKRRTRKSRRRTRRSRR